MLKHTNAIHDDIRDTCEVCGYKMTMGTNLGLHGQEEHGSQYDMSCDNRENYACDVCDSNTNSIDDLDNHMRSKHSKLIDDLVSNISQPNTLIRLD